MLQAFVDDSASSAGERRLYLAAYVQTAEAWAEFSGAWDDACRADPPIEYFHMVEAQSRRGPFKGLSEAKRTKKVFALAGVIQKFAPWGLHTSVSLKDFEEAFKPFAPFPMRSPYFLLFYAITFGIARVHKTFGVGQPCDFIFDENEGLDRKVLPFWGQMCEALPVQTRRLISGSPIFRDDKKVLPLQAADLLAWHIRRKEAGSYPTEYDGIIDMITVENVHSYTHITREHVEAMASKFREFPETGRAVSKQGWNDLIRQMGGAYDPNWRP